MGLPLPEAPARAPRLVLSSHLFYGRDCFHRVVLQPLPRVLGPQTVQRLWPDRGGRWRAVVGEGTRRSHDQESSRRCIGRSFVQQQRALKLERVKALRRADGVKKVLTAILSPPTYKSSGSELLRCCRPPLVRVAAARGSASWSSRKEGRLCNSWISLQRNGVRCLGSSCKKIHTHFIQHRLIVHRKRQWLIVSNAQEPSDCNFESISDSSPECLSHTITNRIVVHLWVCDSRPGEANSFSTEELPPQCSVVKGRGVVNFSYSLPGCSAERTKMQSRVQVKQPRQYSFIYLPCVCF